MIRQREHHREEQFRPQATKTLHQALFRFIRREFPRLGGPWVVNIFVDKLLELVAKLHPTQALNMIAILAIFW